MKYQYEVNIGNLILQTNLNSCCQKQVAINLHVYILLWATAENAKNPNK